jgi:hypothetical protein
MPTLKNDSKNACFKEQRLKNNDFKNADFIKRRKMLSLKMNTQKQRLKKADRPTNLSTPVLAASLKSACSKTT